MNTRFIKTTDILVFAFLFSAALFAISCAAARKEPRERLTTYRVALVNAGADEEVFDNATANLNLCREIDLVSGKELERFLEQFGKSSGDIIKAASFAGVSEIQGLDFALVLMPPPPAYPGNRVGLKSINWRRKTIRVVAGARVPRTPYGWLLAADNGWVVISSDPPGAYISIGGAPAGTAPLLSMVEKDTIDIEAVWTKKFRVSKKVNMRKETKVSVHAPEAYIARVNKRGIYKRIQEADNQYGQYIVVVLYVVILAGGILLLFYTPGVVK